MRTAAARALGLSPDPLPLRCHPPAAPPARQRQRLPSLPPAAPGLTLLPALPRSLIPYANNIMYDKRVVRGNTYAAQILPAVCTAPRQRAA